MYNSAKRSTYIIDGMKLSLILENKDLVTQVPGSECRLYHVGRVDFARGGAVFLRDLEDLAPGRLALAARSSVGHSLAPRLSDIRE
jgi:hypothetical protein